jgi:hypothetical protein
MKTATQIYQQNERIYRKSCMLAVKQAKAADPSTGGNGLMVHNWGNAEAKAAWAKHEQRSHKTQAAFDRLYNAAEHNYNHGDHFRPMWCALCQREAKKAQRNQVSRERNAILREVCGTSARAARLDMGL